ncbi:unnamed protein product, partial [Meganyctiphanes norvegica]
ITLYSNIVSTITLVCLFCLVYSLPEFHDEPFPHQPLLRGSNEFIGIGDVPSRRLFHKRINNSYAPVLLTEASSFNQQGISRKTFEMSNMAHRHSNNHRGISRRSYRTPEPVPQQDFPWPTKLMSDLPGDIILGGLMMVHERKDDMVCGPIMPQGGVQALEVMLYTLDFINDQMDSFIK